MVINTRIDQQWSHHFRLYVESIQTDPDEPQVLLRPIISTVRKISEIGRASGRTSLGFFRPWILCRAEIGHCWSFNQVNFRNLSWIEFLLESEAVYFLSIRGYGLQYPWMVRAFLSETFFCQSVGLHRDQLNFLAQRTTPVVFFPGKEVLVLRNSCAWGRNPGDEATEIFAIDLHEKPQWGSTFYIRYINVYHI